jgi:hypothetical protein
MQKENEDLQVCKLRERSAHGRIATNLNSYLNIWVILRKQ